MHLAAVANKKKKKNQQQRQPCHTNESKQPTAAVTTNQPTATAAHLLQHGVHRSVRPLQRLSARHTRFAHKQAADVKQAFVEQVLCDNLQGDGAVIKRSRGGWGRSLYPDR